MKFEGEPNANEEPEIIESEVSQKIKEAGIEKNKDSETLDRLAGAFGGYSQLPDHVIGMAIVGQINNNGLSIEDAIVEINNIVNQLCERWEDQEIDPNDVRREIIRGMNEEAKDWPKEDRIWESIKAVEQGIQK